MANECANHAPSTLNPNMFTTIRHELMRNRGLHEAEFPEPNRDKALSRAKARERKRPHNLKKDEERRDVTEPVL